ncbi:MAG: OmpH family outer membrane protein [Phycisphaerales bacterium]|nr:OmpH family outer membrane protein [Planctomycetota bacterium]MBL6997332.1 OmpH family outer membrane protein [Phycisphaerales bacterium]
MSLHTRTRRITVVLATIAIVCTVAGYAAVAATALRRPPTVVVTFNISRVTANLTERAASEARLRELVSKIEDEQTKRIKAIESLEESFVEASEAEKLGVIDQLDQLNLEAISYQRFAGMRVDNERSLMFRDIYKKIRKAVADISEENGYDIVLISDDDREIMIDRESNVPREFQVKEQIGLQRVIFASAQTDITEQIVTHMNLEWEKRSDH